VLNIVFMIHAHNPQNRFRLKPERGIIIGCVSLL
jgi:hypothetical protein